MKIFPDIQFPFFKKRYRRSILNYFWHRKDGIITGAADNDPAGIVTYSQVGATTGFSLLWLLVLATPLLVVAEEMSARAGVVTKKGLGKLIRQNYGLSLAVIAVAILAIANIGTAAADMAAVAEIISLAFNVPEILVVVLVGLIFLLLLLRANYKAVSRFLFILTPLLLAYLISAILVKPDWQQVLHETILPQFKFNISYWAMAVGLLGTTISPYLIFWETTQEIEDETSVKELKQERVGVNIGMIYSNAIAFFIIVVCAVTLFKAGTAIGTGKDAALALKPLAGHFSFLLYSMGILAAGFLAIPIFIASTAYAVCDVFRFREGLDEKQWQAKKFYGLIVIATVLAILINFSGIAPVKLLVYTQVLNGFLSPLLLVLVIFLTSNKKIMGSLTSGPATKIIAWLTVAIMLTMDFFMVRSWLGR